MWIMFVISTVGMAGNASITSVEMNTKEACIAAVEYSRKRHYVRDAWCVKK